ncbi:uncharacterized protein LOC124156198 isoform X2 [Ischnura elegans]|nr:uncharacterized protein LOC124156198 isoform X2 [Ischnura elegans]XP_046386541.1 uncharacterized protein LOC124156198 isoform X2 [Ischnura elegans]
MSYLWLSMLITLTTLHQSLVQSGQVNGSKGTVSEGKDTGRWLRNQFEHLGDQYSDDGSDTSERKTRLPRQTAAKDLERAVKLRQRQEYLRESRENFRDVVLRVLHAFLSASNQKLKQAREDEMGRRSAAAIAAAREAAVQASPYLRESLRAAGGDAGSSLVSLPGPHAVLKCDCGKELAVLPVTVVDRSAASRVHVSEDSGTLKGAQTYKEKSTETTLVKPAASIKNDSKESDSSLLGSAKMPSVVQVSEGGDKLREVKRPTTVSTGLGKDISGIGAVTASSDFGGKTLRALQREEMLRNVGHTSGEVAAEVLERMSARVGTAVSHLLLGH